MVWALPHGRSYQVQPPAYPEMAPDKDALADGGIDAAPEDGAGTGVAGAR
jgi:hypothetical protein